MKRRILGIIHLLCMFITPVALADAITDSDLLPTPSPSPVPRLPENSLIDLAFWLLFLFGLIALAIVYCVQDSKHMKRK